MSRESFDAVLPNSSYIGPYSVVNIFKRLAGVLLASAIFAIEVETSRMVKFVLPTTDFSLLYAGNFRVSNAFRILVEVLSSLPARALRTLIAFSSSAFGVL